MKNYFLKFLSFSILLNFAFNYCVTFNLNLNGFSEVPNGNWVAELMAIGITGELG